MTRTLAVCRWTASVYAGEMLDGGVLPLLLFGGAALDPVLERSLTVERITETRSCPVCGRAFLPDGGNGTAPPACAGTALREQKRAYMRRKRR